MRGTLGGMSQASTDKALPLRERKKLRTRRALADQQMFADVAVADATVRSLVEQGLCLAIRRAPHEQRPRLQSQS